MKNMRLPRGIAMLLVIMMLLSCALPVFAADGNVTYSKSAKKFIFAPGTKYSPTDLFPNFKDVMPGDRIYQDIVVKNDRANNCKVKVYMRALGAHEGSEAFLSQLDLTVTKKTDTIMFDATADQTAQLTNWVYLGTLYSGGTCELQVTLDVPVTLDNQFKSLIGYLDWEFAVEELPVESTDPKPPQTGDDSRITMWTGILVGSAVLLMAVMFLPKKKR